MKNLLFTVIAILFVSFSGIAQSISLDPNSLQLPRFATNPSCGVDDKGKLIFNTTENKVYYCDGTEWQLTSNINQWGENGNTLHTNKSVAIGTSTSIGPNTFFTVKGNLGGSNFEGMYVDASSAFGKPFYGYSQNGTPHAFHYLDGDLKWHLNNQGVNRITVTKTGFVGINDTNPIKTLDVNGTLGVTGLTTLSNGLNVTGATTLSNGLNVTGATTISNGLNVTGATTLSNGLNVTGATTLSNGLNITGVTSITGTTAITGGASISGGLTVNNGKGVVYNSQGSTNLKFLTGEYHVSAILAGHARSTEFTIAFNGGFSAPPAVSVADMNSLIYVSGEAYRVIVMVYDCTTTSCKARLVNTSPNAVNYEYNFKIIAVGQ